MSFIKSDIPFILMAQTQSIVTEILVTEANRLPRYQNEKKMRSICEMIAQKQTQSVSTNDSEMISEDFSGTSKFMS